MDHERQHVAEMLGRFIAGSAGDWEFDDFASTKSSDPLIEARRRELIALPRSFPPRDPAHFCSAEGLERIAAIADELGSKSRG